MSKPNPKSKMTAFTVKEVSAGCYGLTDDQAKLLFTPKQLLDGEVRGTMRHHGPCAILTHFSALATSHGFEKGERDMVIYGVRRLSNPTQMGHDLEGTVSVLGHRYRGFTSSTLFELPDKRLISASIIHVCLDQSK